MSPEQQLANLNTPLPCSDEAEKGILSCLLQDPAERIPETQQKLTPEAFYQRGNRIVYETLIAHSQQGIPITLPSLVNTLRDQQKLDQIGGPSTLSELYSFIPVTAHYPYFLKIVQEKYLLRQSIALSADTIAAANQHNREALDQDIIPLLAQAEDKAFNLLITAQQTLSHSASGHLCQVIDAAEMAGQWLDAFEAIKAIPAGTIPGARTPYLDLDRMYGGLAPDIDGDFELIAAYPGMGKSVDFITSLEDLAINQRIPCLPLPLEMGRLSMSHRLHLGRARVNVTHSRNSFPMTRADQNSITATFQDIAQAPIWWDWHSFIEIGELRALAQIILRKHGRKDQFPRLAILIDHFGQLKPSTKAGKSDTLQGQREVLMGLHELRKMGILIKLYAQLDKASREGQASGKTPTNAALKGVSELVEYPTHIRFIHRPAAPDVAPWNSPAMRGKEDPKTGEMKGGKQELWENLTHGYRIDFPQAWCDPTKIEPSKSPAQVDYEEHAKTIVTKNRHGATGEICLRFLPAYQRFTGRTLALYSNNKNFRQVELPGF